MKSYVKEVNKLVETGVKNIKENTVTLNNDKPILDKRDFNTKEGEPIYFDLDELGRSNGAIAILSNNTIPLVIKKNLDYPDPYGWTESLENKNVFERCHIIAYSLSARLADRKNIFIGTGTLNTSIMATIENKIRGYIKENDVRILYKVTVKYKGIDQIPTGILIEAGSLDDDFSVCKFCYNIHKDVKFSYKNGKIIEDNREGTTEKIKDKTNNSKKSSKAKGSDNSSNKTDDYVINRKTNKFHLKDKNCAKLNDVEPKYINETTATKVDLINAGLTACKKCINSE